MQVTILAFLVVVMFLYIISSSMVVEMFLATRTLLPTRNMSYDLRGEAYFPPRVQWNFMNSAIGPLDQ